MNSVRKMEQVSNKVGEGIDLKKMQLFDEITFHHRSASCKLYQSQIHYRRPLHRLVSIE